MFQLMVRTCAVALIFLITPPLFMVVKIVKVVQIDSVGIVEYPKRSGGHM